MSFVKYPTIAEMQEPGWLSRDIKAMAEASAEYEARIKREAEAKAKEVRRG